MINYRCGACGHWMESSDHLIGMTVPCRECGEPIDVPAKSLANVPHASKPSQVARAAALGISTADEPAEEGPLEAGWHRLQETAGRWVTPWAIAGAMGVLAVCAALAWRFLRP
jgi:hypothetical protein